MLCQITSAQGPVECALGVKKALNVLIKEAKELNIDVEVLEAVTYGDGFKSVILNFNGGNINQLINSWSGTILWICPLRKNKCRKNWYFGVNFFNELEGMNLIESDIVLSSCRSSGAGGQHVNKTNSAIIAKYLPLNLIIKVQSERSQHMNKKIALELLKLKVFEKNMDLINQSKNQKRMQHYQLERGNPKRVFNGIEFK